jgi:hypothetical protein
MGRSRGGLTTKIHTVVDANGNPVTDAKCDSTPQAGTGGTVVR